jgi:hypothetical protein
MLTFRALEGKQDNGNTINPISCFRNQHLLFRNSNIFETDETSDYLENLYNWVVSLYAKTNSEKSIMTNRLYNDLSNFDNSLFRNARESENKFKIKLPFHEVAINNSLEEPKGEDTDRLVEIDWCNNSVSRNFHASPDDVLVKEYDYFRNPSNFGSFKNHFSVEESQSNNYPDLDQINDIFQ